VAPREHVRLTGTIVRRDGGVGGMRPRLTGASGSAWRRAGGSRSHQPSGLARLVAFWPRRGGGHRGPPRVRPTLLARGPCRRGEAPGTRRDRDRRAVRRRSASTDLGVPEAIAELEREPLSAGEVERLVCSWRPAGALRPRGGPARRPACRKGPRGRQVGPGRIADETSSRDGGDVRREAGAPPRPAGWAMSPPLTGTPPRSRTPAGRRRIRRRIRRGPGDGHLATRSGASPGTCSITPGRSRTGATRGRRAEATACRRVRLPVDP